MPAKANTIGGLCGAIALSFCMASLASSAEQVSIPQELVILLADAPEGDAARVPDEAAPAPDRTALRLETFKTGSATSDSRADIGKPADHLSDLDALVPLDVGGPIFPEKAPRKASRKTGRFTGILAGGDGKTSNSKGNTLKAVLTYVLSENQELAAAQAQLRAISEKLPQARAGLLPLVTGTAGASTGQSWNNDGNGTDTDDTSASLGLEVKQKLFDGLRSINDMAAARAQIEAERQAYASLTQAVLLNTATAYMSVLRDREVASLRQENLAFVDEQLRAAKTRFDIGEGTITDVAQAESQRALAMSLLETALADVAASEASYEEIVGQMAKDLRKPSLPATRIPASLKAAQQQAERNNPSIQSALHAADAASSKVRAAQGGLLPSVDLTASVQRDYLRESDEAPGLPGVRLNREDETAASVGVKLTIPFYQGGRAISQVREARAIADQRRIEAGRARARVLSTTATAWARLHAARENVGSAKKQVRSAEIALEGVSEEREIGQRTTLDVLDAQAEVISSKIRFIEAERTLIISAYTLLAAMGDLEG